MWSYEKRLQYPVKITQPNAEIAKIIITQYGGPDGELNASMRYLSQRYTMPYNEVAGLLTDIGMSVSKLHIFTKAEIYENITRAKGKQTSPIKDVCLLNISKKILCRPWNGLPTTKRRYVLERWHIVVLLWRIPKGAMPLMAHHFARKVVCVIGSVSVAAKVLAVIHVKHFCGIKSYEYRPVLTGTECI